MLGSIRESYVLRRSGGGGSLGGVAPEARRSGYPRASMAPKAAEQNAAHVHTIRELSEKIRPGGKPPGPPKEVKK